MKKLIIIIIGLVSFGFLSAQYENADAEYLLIKQEYTLNEDGSFDYHYHKEIKLYTHYAFHRLYGETFIIYNTDFQTLKINEAYTIMADGKKVVTPSNAFNEVLPRFANNSPAYNHIREMVVTHTGLEVGAVIHLDYTIHTEKDFYPELMFDETLTETSPVTKRVIKVNIPENKNLKYEALNSAATPTIEKENGKTIYSWTFNNLPASPKDYYQQSNHLDAPRLLFTTAEDLKTVFTKFINQKSANLLTNDCMNDAVGEVLCKNQDQLAVALELQKIVVQNLNKLNIPLNYTAFAFRSPVETWKSNQGTKIERAYLLASLLKQADIEAYPVAIVPKQLGIEKNGNLMTLNEFGVFMQLEDYGELILSVDKIDSQNKLFALEDQTVLILDQNRKSPGFIPSEEKISGISVKGVLNLDETSQMNGKLTVTLEGNANPYLSIYQDPNTLKTLIRGGLSSKNIESFTNAQLSQDISRWNLEINKEEALKKLNVYWSFEIPFIKNGVDSWHMNLLTANRNSSLEIPEKIQENYVYTIIYPESIKPVIVAKNIDIKNAVGELVIMTEKTEAGLEITRKIHLFKKVIQPDVYADFKQIMDAWNNPNYKRIIFKK